jgi:addiction module RelE/StbE family toxin
MVKILWSKQAKFDLKHIYNYIKLDSKYYADIFKQKLFKRVEQLKTFPNSGRIVPEYNCELIRELIYGNYRIIYEIKDNIRILAVAHSKMKIDK